MMKTVILAVIMASLPAVFPSAPAVFQAPLTSRGEWTADTRNTWHDSDGEPRVQFNLRTVAGDSRWGFGVRLRELTGFPASAVSSTATDVQFSWTREAGAFRFTGSFDQGRGSGAYSFTPDQTFIANMAGAGYRNLSSDDIVRMAMLDVTVAHVRGLSQAGYPNLAVDDVIRFRIHKVTPEFVRAMEQRGYRNVPAEDLVRMRIHKVTIEEMDQLKALGFANLSVDQLVRFRVHKVSPEYIRSMRDVGFQSATEEQLLRMRIHQVDAMFVRHAREDGLAVQTPADAIDLAIHGPRWRRRQ